jgi:hypothetical protein
VIFPRDQVKDEDQALDWWDRYADECTEFGVSNEAAALVRTVIASIRAIRKTTLDQAISLAEAARVSGYTAGHLGRLVRAGKITNVGRKGAPKVRQRDLPTKPAKLAIQATNAQSQAVSDARSLRARR